MLFGDAPKAGKFANAGIGENNIDLPLRLSDGLIKTIKVGQFGNVSLDARDFAPDRLHGLVEFLLPTARDEDIGALFDKNLCCSQSNPFGTSGDDSDLTFELFRHHFSPFLLSCDELSAPRPTCMSGKSFRTWDGRSLTVLPSLLPV